MNYEDVGKMKAIALKHLENCFDQPSGNRPVGKVVPAFRKNFTPEEDAALRRSVIGSVASLFWDNHS
jgi:hypothetical protein